MDGATWARIGRCAALAVVVLLIVAYAGVSYFIASGVTGAEREELEDHPKDYGLEYEDVEFLSRKGMSPWRAGTYPPHAADPA